MSVKTNKVYRDVVIQLEKNYTFTQYNTLYNSLRKLYITTEDIELQKLLFEYTRIIQDVALYGQRKLTLRASEIVSIALPYKQSLYNYCQKVLASEKPEWQIIAERNGWRPC